MDSANAYIYAGGGAPAEQVSLPTGSDHLPERRLTRLGPRHRQLQLGRSPRTTSYDAWGNPQTTGGLTAATPFGYAGGYTDPDGLLYLINRYYDPATGQFISVDPAVAQTMAPYAYADGNPVIEHRPHRPVRRLRSRRRRQRRPGQQRRPVPPRRLHRRPLPAAAATQAPARTQAEAPAAFDPLRPWHMYLDLGG